VVRILAGLKKTIDASASQLPRSLREEYESYWPAFTQQIRAARNDAGHPVSIDPISFDTVHASLLIFPELAKLSVALMSWAAAATFS
jgi:hypothetical protein